jgi:flagellin-like hook-associated protein FlgL
VEGVDINEVAVKISAVQTSLDASYRITALMQQMSLVNFI